VKLRQLSAQFRRVPEQFGQTAEELRRVPKWFRQLPETFGRVPKEFRQLTEIVRFVPEERGGLPEERRFTAKVFRRLLRGCAVARLRGCAVARLLSGETLTVTNSVMPLSRHLKEQRKLCQDYFHFPIPDCGRFRHLRN
jgi:hypothetical protein